MTDRDRSLLALALTACLVLAGGPAAAEDTASPTDQALITSAGFAADNVGYLVVDLKDKRVLAEHNAGQAFIPASVAKIATIVPALEILGGDYRFTTTLDAEGSVSDGVLTGSLTLRGGGDPFLTGDDLQAMAGGLAAGGIKQVDGSFRYDASATIALPEIDALQPEAADYNCGVSALSLNFNRVRLKWQTTDGQRSATATEFSDKVRLPIDSVSVTFATADLPGPYVRTGTAADDRWLLSANLPAAGEEWLPVGNPSKVAADAFRAIAAQAGVVLPVPTPGATPGDAREVVRHDSIPLSEIAKHVLFSSNNLSAELIGLAASRALTGDALSLPESASALVDWWRKRLPDADWTGLALDNHSGLSTKSHVTPRQVVAMLEEASRLSGGIDFHDMLRPIGWKGVKGTGRVKTGTMSYVRGLAGYIDTEAGNRLAFAIFFNDAAKRAALDAAFDPHVVAIDALSRRWRNRAIGLERTLATGWAKRF